MIDRRLLLLTPSLGFGGGIERVGAAIAELGSEAGLRRVDLYRAGHVTHPSGAPLCKVGFATRACAAAVTFRPEVILATHAGLLPVAAAAARCCRSEIAFIGMGIEVWSRMDASRRRHIGRSTALAISRYTGEKLAERAGLDPEQVSVIPLSVSPVFAEYAVGRRRGGGSGATLLTVSRIVKENRYKGHFVVAEALSGILDAHPETRWIVVGDGDDLPTLRQRCVELGIDSAVDFRGAVDEGALLEAYEESDIFVLPSVADADATPPVGEGFGLVYAEAACFGIPSVASLAGGGALDFVRHEQTGLLAEDEPAAVTAQTLRLIGDPAFRRRVGESARQQVLDRHLPEHFAAALRSDLSAGG